MSSEKRVAIFVDSRKESGGEYQHLLYTIENIKKNNKQKIKFLIVCLSKKLNLNLKSENIEIKYFSLNIIQRYICYLRNYNALFSRLKKYFFFSNKFENFLKKYDVDLVYFLSPSQYSLYLENIKFFITIPDVDHREHLEFPEVVDNNEFNRKNEIFSKSLVKAQAIITNAEIIKQRLVKYYNISAERIYIISLRPALSVSNFSLDNIDEKKNEAIKQKYNLPKNYIYYPAMYLPHKNHRIIIDTIKELKIQNITINAVFTGSDVGYKKNLINYAKKQNILDNIYFLSFVNDEELPYIYLNSQMIVFPVLMGPTFTPIWEAFKMKKPVIFSDLEGVKNVYGDAVHYINPLSQSEIKNAIEKIKNDQSFKINLVNKGMLQLENMEKEDQYSQVFKIIENYRKLKKTWETDD